MRIQMKTLARSIVFLCILAASVFALNESLSFTDELDSDKIFKEFYAQPADSIDGVYFGNSSAQRGWLAPLVYSEYGFTIASLATANQPLAITRNLMKEAERTQSPKLFIVDLRSVSNTPDDLTDGIMRRVTDNLRESKNRFDTIAYMLDYASKGDNNIDPEDKSYYIKLLKYHSLWDSSKRPEKAGIEYMQGFAYFEKSFYKVRPQKDCGYTADTKAIDPANEKVLNDLMDYCDKSSAEVLFVVSPCQTTRDELMQFNYAQHLAEARGYTVLNFFEPENAEKIKFDYSKIFYNARHMNCYGATNYSRYLAGYISENYGLSDHRADAPREWEDAAEKFMDRTEEKYAEMLEKNDLK